MKLAMGVLSAILSNAIVLVLVLLGHADSFEALLVFWFETFSMIVMGFGLLATRSFWFPKTAQSHSGDLIFSTLIGSFVAFFSIVILAILFEFQKKAQGIDTDFKVSDFDGAFVQAMDIFMASSALWPALVGVLVSNFMLLKETLIRGVRTQNDAMLQNGFLLAFFALFRILWLTGASLALVSIFESLLPMIVVMTLIKMVTDILAIKKLESRVFVPPHLPA